MDFVLTCILFTSFQTDSAFVDSTINKQSIMFQSVEAKQIKSFKYKHIQGFFCDFEDKINRKNKININIGVGKQ